MAEEFNLEAAMETTMNETAESLAGEQTTDGEQGAKVEDSISAAKPAAGATPVAAAPETPTSDYPKSWKQELAPKWSTLDPEVRAEVLRREKDILDGIGTYKERAALADRFHKTLEPYMENIKQAANGDAFAAIQSLLNADHTLRHGTPEQKQAFMQTLVRQYGIQDQEQQAQKTPEVLALEARLAKIEGTMTDAQRRAVADMREKTARDVQEFAADTAKHPYFDELSDDIVKLINAGYNLNEAYGRAVWANEATRTKELARMQKESENALKEKAKAETAAAKKARGTVVSGRDTGKEASTPLGTWDDTMKETLERINASG